jgi:GNAT superfamily N-acetyltransferase
VDSPSFRRATAADRAPLERMVAAYREEDRQPPQPAVVARALDAALSGDPLIHIWMIEAAGEPVGYVALSLGFSLEVGGRDALVDELYLDAAVRGRGLGGRALEFVVEECRKLDVRRVCLEVERHNDGARRLYERAGFRDHDRTLMSRWIVG